MSIPNMRRPKSGLKSRETVFAGIWVNTSRRKHTISNGIQTHHIHILLSAEGYDREESEPPTLH